ncbi:hypothetical protein ACHAWO_012163 [Cyclotella atomus]|uniref:Uncharacterized protein n=1 Tax=Cyclotella atomus TaxID=382360 RepID=A0ABD3NQ50_9STRA
MKFSSFAQTILALSASGVSVDAVSNKQYRSLQNICSCAPQAFSFTLLLAQDCSTNTLEANPGISDTNCAIVNATTDAALTINSEDDQMIAVADIYVPIDEILACIPWLSKCNVKSVIEPIRNRELQTGSPIPSVITSIQFIELDSDGTVIQIDDSQNNINAVSGDTFSYASKASQLDPAEDISTQLDNVPKTAVLFLVGFNDDGDEIRGRFVWEYTNGCGEDELAITGGENYAWISFDQVDRAIPEFCPALKEEAPVPTPAPFVIDKFPTPPPMIDTPLPTPSPTVLETSEPSIPPITPTLSPITLAPITETPSTLFFPSFNPTDTPTIQENPTPNPTIVDILPTARPVVVVSPTDAPVSLLFPTMTPTTTPSDMGQLPTTQRPVSDEPTYIVTQTTPFPTSFYGYGEEYNVAQAGYGEVSNVAYVVDSKSGKGESVGSKSGKGSKSAREKSGKSSKGGRGGSKSGKSSTKTTKEKSGKSSDGGHKYDNNYVDNDYGYERKRQLKDVAGLKRNMLRRKK